MFTFAWCEEEDAFDPELHGVEDELVFSFEITEEEHTWCTMDVELLNSFTGGFLTPGKQWVWFAEDGVPLFKGRILGVPQQIDSRVILVSFYGRASDHEIQKVALADTMKVWPYVDLAFVAEERRNDPDIVLDARTDYWHIDRITHEVGIVSAINPTTVYDLTSEIFEGTLQFSHSGEPPVSLFHLTARAQWDQIARNQINIASAFPILQTFTGVGLIEDWPQENLSLGSDYSLGPMTVYYGGGRSEPIQFVGFSWGFALLWTFTVVEYNIRYSVVRRREEILEFTMQAGVQSILSDPGNGIRLDEQLSTSSLNELLDNNGTTSPLADPRLAVYFSTPRGTRSIEYLIQYASTKLLLKAGQGELSAEISYNRGKTLTLHEGFSATDSRLPNNTVSSKISRIVLRGNGDGNFSCELTGRVMCGTGEANPITEITTPVWVNHGWVESGWQAEVGGTVVVGPGNIGYSSVNHILPNDDGIDFFNPRISDFLDRIEITPPLSNQVNVLNQQWESESDVRSALGQVPTRICVYLKPISKSFSTHYPVSLTDLSVPKMVDL